MKTHEAPVCRCPHCGHKFDRATNAELAENDPANPGDFSICFGCERVLVFRDDLTLRPASADEVENNLQLLAPALAALKATKAQTP